MLILYSPHLLWQWQHDWVSFRYHLFESNVSAYKFSYTTEYLLGQLLLAGPLVGFILLPAAFIYKTKNETEKALKFTLVGVYLIFFISSFRGKVEVNWPMPALVPLIILSHQFIIDKISWLKPLRIIAFISLLLIVAGRLYLVVDIGPDNSVKKGSIIIRNGRKQLQQKPGIFLLSFIIPISGPHYTGFIAANNLIHIILIGTGEATIISGQQKATCWAKKFLLLISMVSVLFQIL